MEKEIKNVRYRLPHLTDAQWTSKNPTLKDGEVAFSRDNRMYKVGDGVSAWSKLLYNNAANADVASKVKSVLTIQANGNPLGTYDGSIAKTFNITAATIGAALSSHTHTPASIGAAPISHTHDDRYFTETEINSKLASKSDTSHTHNASGITSGTLSVDRIPSIPVNKLSGIISSSNLPAYVDDVLEYNSLSMFPTSGESGKIYIDKGTNKTYRWSGTTYIEIGKSLVLGTTSSTAYRGDYGDAAYRHSLITGSNPHNITKSLIGLGNVENKSSATIRKELTKNDVVSALGYTPPMQDTNTTYSLATAYSDGLMSKTDFAKINCEDITLRDIQNITRSF